MSRPVDPVGPSCHDLRHDWTEAEARRIHDLPLPELLFRAQEIHRRHFDPAAIETATLLSIKTGGCPEDCGYCSQSAKWNTGVKASKLMQVESVLAEARRAKSGGATRFCMGAAWRSPKDRDLEAVCAMIEGVKALGLETCVTLGMLAPSQVERLAEAGLDYYNHNIDTSRDFYGEIVTTRRMDDRLETLDNVRAGGIKVCCGGIVGMGETSNDRISMLVTLATLERHPESVPLNMWQPISGTPVMATAESVDPIAFVRLVALARILMPQSVVRLSAGRSAMSDEAQALCFIAGANSIFTGNVLLTTGNPDRDKDSLLLERLGMRAAPLAPHRSDQAPTA
ncbi:biotin synthase BioB [Reyranella sp.]|jgi:biotin synthase|uniref:biotin synthase BioB n=1 Tax=Reyranella sp. TaxID=1929291 RepID=UPI000BDD83B2|nr:biotin synthase BioB [Reyranella sp.]OYY34634.1 MAG: biotin synthase BioB [Rhodospirillales bacterium 35-66-84]OYZ91063.1 MAG: biotin synthase BioB [Rhodospirillales bacterium 24-66-33]OZB21555.1 MAG: biotin synthase BioB [Rhodospirillales bacterium 39-66-50]HQS19117.1 biotin synthase BioB [Reyranella sp.]HQT15319.1 biotin synthase BioB [Reyranella sp.]